MSAPPEANDNTGANRLLDRVVLFQPFRLHARMELTEEAQYVR
jgi:hypothetical protein